MKKNIKTIVFIIACIIMVTAMFATCAEAKSRTPRNGLYTDSYGYTYIYKHGKMKTGWVHYKGHDYYAHQTGSSYYPKGSVVKSGYRVKNNKLYYFNHKGHKQTKSTKFVILNKNRTSVHYIYAPNIDGSLEYRFNANHRRYQHYDKRTKKWRDVGMQCFPYGAIDWQK